MPDAGMLTALVSALVTLGGGVAWYVRRRDTAKDPIPKQVAAVALADQSVSMMRDVANEVRSDMANLRAELVTLRKENERNATRMQSLEASVETLDSALTAAIGYIEHLIRYMRGGAHGPEPVVPERLRDLIDPMLHEWGRRT